MKHLAQDFELVRLYIEATDFTRVLRWRHLEDQPFRSAKEVGLMKEDNMQHCAGMFFMGQTIIMTAREEGDSITSALDFETVSMMIFAHDADEYLTGDVRSKCGNFRKIELRARDLVYKRLAKLRIGSDMLACAKDYHDKKLATARFVKALDELQAWVYMIQTRGFAETSRNFSNPEEIPGYIYALEFPTLARLAKILLRFMRKPSFITTTVQELSIFE